MNEFREKLELLKAKRKLLADEVSSCQVSMEQARRGMDDCMKCRWLLTEAARITQEDVSRRIEKLGTLAIRSVFMERDFSLVLEFETKRNQSECTIKVREGDGEPFIPKDEMGGSIVDLIGFTMRVVLWSMSRPRPRNVIKMDEPMHFMGNGELLLRTAKMVKQVSGSLRFQLIIVTHAAEFAELADRAWKVSHDGTESTVKLISEGGVTSNISDAQSGDARAKLSPSLQRGGSLMSKTTSDQRVDGGSNPSSPLQKLYRKPLRVRKKDK